MKAFCEKHVPPEQKRARDRALQTKIRGRYKLGACGRGVCKSGLMHCMFAVVQTLHRFPSRHAAHCHDQPPATCHHAPFSGRSERRLPAMPGKRGPKAKPGPKPKIKAEPKPKITDVIPSGEVMMPITIPPQPQPTHTHTRHTHSRAHHHHHRFRRAATQWVGLVRWARAWEVQRQKVNTRCNDPNPNPALTLTQP